MGVAGGRRGGKVGGGVAGLPFHSSSTWASVMRSHRTAKCTMVGRRFRISTCSSLTLPSTLPPRQMSTIWGGKNPPTNTQRGERTHAEWPGRSRGERCATDMSARRGWGHGHKIRGGGGGNGEGGKVAHTNLVLRQPCGHALRVEPHGGAHHGRTRDTVRRGPALALLHTVHHVLDVRHTLQITATPCQQQHRERAGRRSPIYARTSACTHTP